jgi:hypothetical protein
VARDVCQYANQYALVRHCHWQELRGMQYFKISNKFLRTIIIASIEWRHNLLAIISCIACTQRQQQSNETQFVEDLLNSGDIQNKGPGVLDNAKFDYNRLV